MLLINCIDTLLHILTCNLAVFHCISYTKWSVDTFACLCLIIDFIPLFSVYTIILIIGFILLEGLYTCVVDTLIIKFDWDWDWDWCH